jgi:hypothetical protein
VPAKHCVRRNHGIGKEKANMRSRATKRENKKKKVKNKEVHTLNIDSSTFSISPGFTAP